MQVGEKFYDDLLFHHGPFRRIDSFLKIQALGSIASAHSNLTDNWFGPYISDTHLLGDPGINDAAIHCHQASRPSSNLLPTGAGQIAINPNTVEGPLFIKTFETRMEDNYIVVDVVVVNAKGEVNQFWKDMVLTKVSGTSFTGKWDPHFLLAHMEHKLIELTGKRSIEIPLATCLEMVNSLEKNNRSTGYKTEGYDIYLEKAKALKNGNGTAEQGKWVDTSSEQGRKSTLTLDIINLQDSIQLQIAPLKPSTVIQN